MRYIISLTTIPPRLDRIGDTLQSLLKQKVRPEEVRLYLPKHYRRFPEYAGAVPNLPEGVRLIRPEVDLGPATKVLEAVRDLRGQDVELLYCDDDHLYLRDWAQRLLAARARLPGVAITVSGWHLNRMLKDYEGASTPRAVKAPPRRMQASYLLRRIGVGLARGGRKPIPVEPIYKIIESSGYADICEGFGGVALRPDFFDDLVYDIPPVLWSVDDIWISGHLARRGVKIWAEEGAHRFRMRNGPSSTEPLYAAEIEGHKRHAANLACVEYMRRVYGVWGGSAADAPNPAPGASVQP